MPARDAQGSRNGVRAFGTPHPSSQLAQLGALVGGKALGLAGCGTLTAAKLVAEVAGVERLASDAKLAKLAGVAPLDASSGTQRHHHLNRKGNRQLNLALRRIAVTQGQVHAPARAFLARKHAGFYAALR